MRASRKRPLLSLSLAAVLGCAIVPTAHAAGSGTSHWNHVVGLYLWGTSINGTATIGPVSAPVDLDFKDDLLDNLAGAFAAHYEGKRDRLSLFGDYFYADLDPRAELANGAELDVDFKQTIWELGAAWDITGNNSDATVQVLGGVRSTKQEMRAAIQAGPVLLSRNETWYDGFIGGRVIAPFARNWRFIARADVGAGDSDTVWNIAGSVDWRFHKNASVLLGYRWLDFDYDNGKTGGERYIYDARQDGPGLAVNFYW